MVIPRRYVLDAGDLACLGLVLRDGGRRADLRVPLALSLAIARSGADFLCLVDSNLPFRVREEERDLLDLALACLPDRFQAVPKRAQPQDYALQRAAQASAAIVAGAWLDRPDEYVLHYPWLAQEGRRRRPFLDAGTVVCAGLETFSYALMSAFDLYHELNQRIETP